MMRVAMAVGVSLAVLAGAAWADDIYRWTDPQGNVHFSNTPTTGGDRTDVGGDERAAAPAAEAAEGTPEALAADPGFSTDASLRRNALERDVRTTERTLRDLDARLAGMARVRTAHARGDASTGGVPSLAAAYQTDEEKDLAAERARVAKHADDLQAEYGKLHDEVVARLGTTPPWWIDLRPGRR